MEILGWLIAAWRAPSQDELDRDAVQPRVIVVDVCPLTYSYWALEDPYPSRPQPLSDSGERAPPA